MTLVERFETLETVSSNQLDQILTVKSQYLASVFVDLKLLIPDLFAIAVVIRQFYLSSLKFRPL